MNVVGFFCSRILYYVLTLDCMLKFYFIEIILWMLKIFRVKISNDLNKLSLVVGEGECVPLRNGATVSHRGLE